MRYWEMNLDEITVACRHNTNEMTFEQACQGVSPSARIFRIPSLEHHSPLLHPGGEFPRYSLEEVYSITEEDFAAFQNECLELGVDAPVKRAQLRH